MQHGLFEVVPGVYQVRGFDIANMTLIEGDGGVIVVDTLTSIEGARAAVELYFKYRGSKPVAAVIFTHTHTDHWGGARGVLDDEMLANGRVPIIAPNLFMEHAVSENIIAGPAMLRRAQYQFGLFLAKGPRGQVDCGLGKSMATGSVALLRRPISSWRPATSGPSMGWNSNSRWRRIAKRPRRCIFTCRATGF
jgi:alkyl sulfatase BDS1-like metallo-beta-lactamase superfamily hydrolase